MSGEIINFDEPSESFEIRTEDGRVFAVTPDPDREHLYLIHDTANPQERENVADLDDISNYIRRAA